jgi:predicted ATP-grasp superfamily ATP-dependent carboligase
LKGLSGTKIGGKKPSESVLLIGIHTRPAVFSAKSLDFYTLSVDYFGDVDLKEAADVSRSIRVQKPFDSSGRISENYSGEKLRRLAKGFDADKTILTCSINFHRPVVGNRPEKVLRLKDKGFQLRKVRRLGLKVPDFEVVDDAADARDAAEYLGLPCIIKPLKGAGGVGVSLIKNVKEIPDIREKYLVQRFVVGKPISASTLSTKNSSMMLSTSEQLLGCDFAGQRDFVYTGNIVSIESAKAEQNELEDMSIKISKKFGVVGWNGIDFVLEREPVFIEINPRFQGTFDCIENTYEINLLDAHIRASEGELIKRPTPIKTSVRITLFARERSIVTADLGSVAADVPLKNSIIEEGEPVTTIITSGVDALNRCKALSKLIYEKYLSPFP